MREWFAHGKRRQTIKWAEFCEWMRDKTLYYTDVYWKRKWRGDGWTEGKPGPSDPNPTFPPGAFVLPDTFQLRPDVVYGKNDKGNLSGTTTDGRNYWECPGYCRASRNEKNMVVYLTYG